MTHIEYKLTNIKNISDNYIDIPIKDIPRIDYELIDKRFKFTKEPDWFIAYLTNVSVDSDIFIIIKNNSLVYDYMYYHNAKNNFTIKSSSIFFPNKEKIFCKGQYFLLGGHNNYYHWIMNWLPRVRIYLKYIEIFKECKIIVNHDLSKFQKETLKLLGIDLKKLFIVKKNKIYEFEKLYVSPIIDLPNHSISIINFYRDNFFLNIKSTNNLFLKNKKSRIYISRENARARFVINEKELLSTFQSFNISIIHLDNMNFLEQINLFSNVELIITPHGAGLTNMIFTNMKIKVIELQNEKHHSNVYWNLGKLCMSIKYEILKCKDTSSNDKIKPYLRDMEVNPKELENLLNRILK